MRRLNAITASILLVSASFSTYAGQNENTLSQQDSFTYERIASFSDAGKVKTVWQPKTQEGFGILSQLVTAGTEAPKFVSVTINLDELYNDKIALPVDFKAKKSIKGMQGEALTLWTAQCPQGFVSKGHLVTTGNLPALDALYCVAEKLMQVEATGSWVGSKVVTQTEQNTASNSVTLNNNASLTSDDTNKDQENQRSSAFVQVSQVQDQLRSIAATSVSYSYANWMNELQDSTPVGRLTIPGTHDTGAYSTSDLFETQTWSPAQQLANGIRFFDIRLSDRNGSNTDFELRHGEGRLGSFEGLVLNKVYSFLEQNPSEVIFMSVKHEKSNIVSTGTDEFDKKRFYRDYIEPANSRFYKYPVNGATALSNLRGKIVLIDRYGVVNSSGSSVNIGINYPSSYYIQDNYNLEFECKTILGIRTCGPHIGLDYPGKYDDVHDHLNKAWNNSSSPNIWINFTSATWNTGYEKNNARHVNGRLKTKLDSLVGGVGIGTMFPMDYPEETPGIIDSMIKMSITAHGKASKQPTIIPNRAIGTQSNVDGYWGNWGSIAKCPAGQFVRGYRLRSESEQGSGDDTALNDIELYCSPLHSTSNSTIYSAYASWGAFSSQTFCSGTNNPVIGFDVKIESNQGSGDDTAANDVDLYCQNGTMLSASVNTNWGNWSPKHTCPSGKAVVGIMTRVESKQGDGDDTALNGVRLICENL